MDVAERLFAERGFDGVSVRDITDAAEVRLASVNYHFKTKQNLFKEVIQRRASVLNDDRRAALEEIELDTLSPQQGVQAIARAFIYPIYQRSTLGDPGWKNYCRLIAQLAALRSSSELTAETFNPVALDVIDRLRTVLPDLDERRAHYALQYLIGAMVYVFSENERLDILSNRAYSSHDLEALCADLVTFVSGGIIAMLAS
nr:TetR/AcrR family transcriptional regulator [Parahaliea mediterranea]